MGEKDVDILFEFLSSILFKEKKAVLDTSQLSKDFRDLGDGLNFLSDCVEQLREFSTSLARGDLDAPSPPRDNHLVWPLKALQSNLQHLTWQTQQVAQGDYSQHVDFLGDFSDAFNMMIRQLHQREISLKQETEKVSKKAAALEESKKLFENITDSLPEPIVIMDHNTGDILYRNRVSQSMYHTSPELCDELYARMRHYSPREDKRTWDYTYCHGRENAFDRHYQFRSFQIEWGGLEAAAHIIADITEQRAHARMMEAFAYNDPNTGLYNRRYCMERLQLYLDQGKRFALCFIDLDHLKEVNDTYGHNEGDHYINALAQVLRDTMRQGDTICRLGGDEFVVLMPGCPEALALKRMRDDYSAFRKSGEDKPYEFSYSYGVVETGGDEGHSAQSLLDLADGRMYEFKKLNRNMRDVVS